MTYWQRRKVLSLVRRWMDSEIEFKEKKSLHYNPLRGGLEWQW